MIKRRPLQIKDISINSDDRFGNFTVFKIEYINDINIPKNDIFFIGQELGNILGLSKVRNSISLLPDQCKLILKNEDIEKFRCLEYGRLKLDKLNNRGTTIINLSGLQRLIFKSRKQIAIEYQNWIFDFVLPQIWRRGGYYDPVEADINIRKIFSTVIYNHTENNNYLKSINSNEYDKYKLIINKDYELLNEDKLLQLRIYDMAFYLFFGMRITQLIADAKSINNYMIVVSDFGGPDAVDFVYHFVCGTIRLIRDNGIPINNIEYGIYGINTSMALYRIPNGTKYTNYQISKLPPKVDFDKLHKEAWENAPKHGINIDEVVDK